MDDSYETFVSLPLWRKPSILEVGCGLGTVTSWLINNPSEASILVTDVAPEMVEEAQEYVENIQFRALDASEIDSINEQFDTILAEIYRSLPHHEWS